MACNQKIVYKYNSYATRKIPYIKNKPMMLTTVYQEWYKQRKNNNQESFDKQLNKNITIE